MVIHSGWDTSAVDLMSVICCFNCDAFDQDLSSWDVTAITTGNWFHAECSRYIVNSKL